jgi:hypothetical protein
MRTGALLKFPGRAGDPDREGHDLQSYRSRAEETSGFSRRGQQLKQS